MKFIVGREKDVVDSLFNPGGTINVILRRVNKKSIKFKYAGKDYTLNCHGVICSETKIDGKTFYQFGCLDFPGTEYNGIIEAINQFTGR